MSSHNFHRVKEVRITEGDNWIDIELKGDYSGVTKDDGWECVEYTTLINVHKHDSMKGKTIVTTLNTKEK